MAASIPVKPSTKDFLESQKPDGVTWDQYLLSLAVPVADDVSARDVAIAKRRLAKGDFESKEEHVAHVKRLLARKRRG